jgi:hypothetical protein
VVKGRLGTAELSEDGRECVVREVHDRLTSTRPRGGKEKKRSRKSGSQEDVLTSRERRHLVVQWLIFDDSRENAHR